MDSCISEDFEAKIDEVTSHFNTEIKKIKTELQSSQASLQVNTASLVQLQRENAWLKENFHATTKNLENITSQVQLGSESSSEEAIYFDYGLKTHMTSTGTEVVKFDYQRAVSTTKIYDETTGKVTIPVDGRYYFYVHGLPYEKSGWFSLYIYVDDELACKAYKDDGTRANMSCAIVRHFKRGQTIYVKKSNKLSGSGNPYTGFLGFKIQ